MKQKKTRQILLLAAAGILPFTLAGCSHSGGGGEGGDSAATTKAEVTLAKVVRADVEQTLTADGDCGSSAESRRKSKLTRARTPGELEGICEGDHVKAGELIAKLDDHTYRDQMQQAEAAEAQAKATLENAKLNQTRNENLVQRGIGAGKDLEDSRMQQSVATAALQQSEAALRLARLQVSRTDIQSPISGVVVKRFVSDGEQVDGTAAQPIVEVANLQTVEFLGNAPGGNLGKLHAGEAVTVTSQAAPDKKFQGHVIAVSPAIDPATGVGLVRIRVPNTGDVLRLGTFLNADIPVDTHKKALCIPPQALYHDETGAARIYVVNKDQAVAVPVTVGIETSQLVELVDPKRE